MMKAKCGTMFSISCPRKPYLQVFAEEIRNGSSKKKR
jgi:hypothetical protein